MTPFKIQVVKYISVANKMRYIAWIQELPEIWGKGDSVEECKNEIKRIVGHLIDHSEIKED